MWTWQFQLDDTLTTVTIIGVIGGAGYRLLVAPVLNRISDERLQDNLLFNERMNSLLDTLKELKEEIKLSREQRAKQYSAHLQLQARVKGLEARVDELRGDIHEHISKAH